MRIAIVLKKLRVSLMGFCFDLVQKFKKKKKNSESHDNSSQDHSGLGNHSLG